MAGLFYTDAAQNRRAKKLQAIGPGASTAPHSAMPPAAALPKQLQFILKQADIPIPRHEACLHLRAVAQMTEYLKIVNMRTGPNADANEHLYDLTELLGFVNSLQDSP